MPRLIALIGPTAVGKTDVAIELALRLGAEIVGCDSMQVYRGMAHLTQQPAAEQQSVVAHHLVDCIEPTEAFSVGQYRRAALEAIRSIHDRGNDALIVGGTGLYLRALTDGLCEAPPADERVRRELAAVAQARGSAALHERLKTRDPLAAAKIHPHDTRRLVRALEVYELTGEPLSGRWGRRDGEALPMTVIGLTREREELYSRINVRVERMIRAEDVLEEVRRVRGRRMSHTARQVHGLAYLEAYLDGTRGLEETITLWQRQVRQYARRQLVWFRANPRIQWITIAGNETSQATVERICSSG
ncbi:MAG: tRNA (adenosine(37)-N6)-dimethylallyltransferase MiaA [Candidatus Omnitrophica bacterium]|nr:tRNA (adenosine(37)-N6)-dimethylallyltransferase MiaA [Candidatus Omnitrophota bacterium]